MTVFLPLNSTAFHSSSYDPETKEMQVRYHLAGCPVSKETPCACEGGRTYRYPDTERQAYDDLTAAESFGKHFHANWTKKGIKGEAV